MIRAPPCCCVVLHRKALLLLHVLRCTPQSTPIESTCALSLHVFRLPPLHTSSSHPTVTTFLMWTPHPLSPSQECQLRHTTCRLTTAPSRYGSVTASSQVRSALSSVQGPDRLVVHDAVMLTQFCWLVCRMESHMRWQGFQAHPTCRRPSQPPTNSQATCSPQSQSAGPATSAPSTACRAMRYT